MTYYTSMVEHAIFVENMIEEQRSMEDYISECAILSSNDRKHVFNELAIFNEGKMTDKIKGFFQRVKAFFARIFKKFGEKLNAWVLDEKQYLDKYKDIIIGKKVNLEKVTMKNHFDGKKRIDEVINKYNNFGIVPSEGFYTALRGNSIRGSTEGSKLNPELFNNDLRKKLIVDDLGIKQGIRIADNVDYTEECNNYFNGGDSEVDFTAGQLNMEVIFNALYQYKTTYNGLASLKKSFDQCMTKIEQEYNTHYKDAVAELKNNPKAGFDINNNIKSDDKNSDDMNHSRSNNNNNNTAAFHKANKNDLVKTESYLYSRVYNGYLNEIDITTSSKSSDSSNNTSSVKTDTAKAAKNTESERMTKVNNSVTDKQKDSETKAGNYGTIDAVTDKSAGIDVDAYVNLASKYFQAYSNARTILFGAMLNGLTSMRNDYMQIVRAHVNSYLGKIDNSEDNTNKKSVTTSSTTTTTKQQTSTTPT